jgi:hypothetical protein
MVAFSDGDPIGVLIGAKRPSGTLIQKIAVHPDHARQGHARHLLASLGSKLAILGPPRLIAEVPEAIGPACELFRASGYTHEALLTDYIWEPDANDLRGAADPSARPQPARRDGASQTGFIIPITVDDLAANGLLPERDAPRCWERSVETLTARKDDIAGLAIASDERIEAYVLFAERGMGPEEPAGVRTAEIVSLCAFIEDEGARLEQLLVGLRARGLRTLRIPKVHPAEIPQQLLETLGFRPAGRHRLYAATARSG